MDTSHVIAGVDEAGRGALAGPVVACSVAFKSTFDAHDIIDDSKKINESSKTVYQKIMKILQKGANVREATLLGIICGYSFGYDVAKDKIEEEMKNRLFNAFKNSNRNQ